MSLGLRVSKDNSTGHSEWKIWKGRQKLRWDWLVDRIFGDLTAL